MTHTTAEFKIMPSNPRERVLWDDLPVSFRRSLPTHLFGEKQAMKFFSGVADVVVLATGGCEVRWNYVGSKQGHYRSLPTNLGEGTRDYIRAASFTYTMGGARGALKGNNE